MVAKTKYVGALAAGALVAVGLLVLMMLMVGGRPAEATFPGENGRIAYTGIDRHGHDFEIFTIKPSGRGRVRVTHDKAHQEHFSFAPNGKKIAYSAPDSHSEAIIGTADEEIYTMNVGGGSRFQLTNNNNRHDIAPAYSPDGKRIAYEVGDLGLENANIYTINATGGKPVKLTPNKTHGSYPDYSPSGKRIAYVGSDGHDSEIYTISATGGKPFQVTHNRTADASPSYSPSGKRIAYVGSHGHGHTEIYTINAGGGDKFQVTNTNANDFDPSYSPDGKKIAYVGRAGIYTIKVTGGKPFNVTNNTTDYVGDPSWLSRP
jgi:TolB protein